MSARDGDVLRPATAGRPGQASSARAASVRYGVRLAAAVLFAFGLSAALRLPEGFWAVMSALIVVRPSTGSTLSAGWDRIRGALLGTVLGLAGVGLRHAMGGSDAASGIAPLALVTALAFGAGLSPALRSAPISALIVVTSGGIPGHSAGQVALLRALEIGIGVGAALLVSLVDARSRATVRFRVAVAEQLRDIAAMLSADPASRTEAAAEARAAEARRAAIRELVILAGSADHETRLRRLLRRPGTTGSAVHDAGRHRRSALLVARTSNDATLFARARHVDAATQVQTGDATDATAPGDARATRGAAPPADDALTAERLTAARLIAMAEALDTGRPLLPVSAPVSACSSAQGPARQSRDPVSFVLALLDDDLRALGRLEGLHAARVP